MEVDDFTDDQLGMAELYEMDADTRDVADAYAILDDIPVRALDECEVCGAHQCRHYCGFCRATRACPCDVGGEISQKESRDMYARAGLGPSRRQRP